MSQSEARKRYRRAIQQYLSANNGDLVCVDGAEWHDDDIELVEFAYRGGLICLAISKSKGAVLGPVCRDCFAKWSCRAKVDSPRFVTDADATTTNPSNTAKAEVREKNVPETTYREDLEQELQSVCRECGHHEMVICCARCSPGTPVLPSYRSGGVLVLQCEGCGAEFTYVSVASKGKSASAEPGPPHELSAA